MAYQLYSFVAAIVIALLNFFVLFTFQISNAVIIAACTFFFAFFTYTIDHYFDGIKGNNPQLHARHKVSQRGFAFATKGFALTCLVSVYFFWYMPVSFLIAGFILAFLYGLYFLLIAKKIIKTRVKLAAAAVILSLIMAGWIFLNWINWQLNVGYFVIVILSVYSNLRFFAWVDFDYDKKWFSTVVITPISKQRMMLIQGLLAIAIFLLGFVIGKGQTWMFIPLTYMLLSALVDKKNLTGNVARVLLDLTMLLPVLVWLVVK